MNKVKNKFLTVSISLMLFSFVTSCNNESETFSQSDIKLPPGFKIDVYADDVPNARSMCLSSNGILFVGTREDRVFAVVDTNKDNRADEIFTIASGLNSPNGVAFKDGSLYVAEISKVWR
jgi:hypothetical protein